MRCSGNRKPRERGRASVTINPQPISPVGKRRIELRQLRKHTIMHIAGGVGETEIAA